MYRFTAIGYRIIEGLSLLYLFEKFNNSSKKCKLIGQQLEKEKILRKEERYGRIKLQKEMRKLSINEGENTGSEHIVSSNGLSSFHFQPIATIESPFPDRRGTPRQPQLVPAAKGVIRFNKTIIQHEHFAELSQFSHIWIIFVFHDNTNTDKSTGNLSSNKAPPAKIKPPRLGSKVGVLSTRSPHRPNNIGLSVCEIAAVGKDFIEILCVDMVDGTPVLDVKPYIPYDVIPSKYFLPMACSAKGEPLNKRLLQVPSWVVEADIEMKPVIFSNDILNKLEEFSSDGHLRHCINCNEIMELITQVLRQDIRGVHQGRGTAATSDSSSNQVLGVKDQYFNAKASNYCCRIDGLDIQFDNSNNSIYVTEITKVLAKQKHVLQSLNEDNASTY
eukprot:gene8640-11680_t